MEKTGLALFVDASFVLSAGLKTITLALIVSHRKAGRDEPKM